MRIQAVSPALAGAAILLATAGTADAQNSTPVDVSAGYQFARLLGSDGAGGTNLPGGWTASVTGHVRPALNLVGEVNGAYSDDVKLHNFLGGLRIGGGRSGWTNAAMVFGQFLTGVGHSSGDNAFLMQPGIGLDIRGTGRMSTRVSFDYLIARSNGETNQGFRVAAGLVFDLNK